MRRVALDLDAALTAAVHAAYAAQRVEIGARGFDDRIFRRKAMAKPNVHALTAEAERLLTLRETHRLNSIPPEVFEPSPLAGPGQRAVTPAGVRQFLSSPARGEPAGVLRRLQIEG